RAACAHAEGERHPARAAEWPVRSVVRAHLADRADRGKDEIEDGIEPAGDGEGHRWAPQAGPGSAGGGLVLALEAPLALDAVAREGERIEPLLADRLAASLALPEAPFVELPERGHHLPHEAAVAGTQLQLEPADGRGARLDA